MLGLAALGFSVQSAVQMTRARGPYSVASALIRGGLGIVPAALFTVGAVLVLTGSAAALPVIGLGMLSAVAVSAVAIHVGVLTQTNIFSDYWNGRPITAAGAAVAELTPTASANDVALLK